MSTSTLIAHVDCVRRSRVELLGLPTPVATDTWKPVPHFDLVNTLATELDRRNIVIAREEYATGGKDEAKLFGVMDLLIDGLDTLDFRMAIGLRGSNDKSMAIQVISAARVFVCDNMAFSGYGGSVVLRKKHTSRLDLRSVVPPAIDLYLEKAGAFTVDIDRMKNSSLTTSQAKELIYDAFAAQDPLLPIRLFSYVHLLYFDDEEQKAKFPDRSLWSLNNAFTEAVKDLRPIPQHQRGTKIGRFFGRLVRKGEAAPVELDGDIVQEL